VATNEKQEMTIIQIYLLGKFVPCQDTVSEIRLIYLKGKFDREAMIWTSRTKQQKLKKYVRMPKLLRKILIEKWLIKYISV
jgi:hypothetical protein